MTDAKPPRLIVFAGANGAGKTTLAKYILPKIGVIEFVNADEIAKGLSPLNPQGQKLTAGKLVIARVHEFIQSHKSFAVETTLSGLWLVAILKTAKTRGYQIEMFYLSTSDSRINSKRIRNCVKEGGHDVPDADVKRRFGRSLSKLFYFFVPLCDRIEIFDNTDGRLEGVAVKAQNQDFVVLNVQKWTLMQRQVNHEQEN